MPNEKTNYLEEEKLIAKRINHINTGMDLDEIDFKFIPVKINILSIKDLTLEPVKKNLYRCSK